MIAEPQSEFDAIDEIIELRYVLLDEAAEWIWEENAKLHDVGSLVESIWRYGFQDPPKYNAALDRFDYGNGRVEALLWGRKEGREPPRGVKVEDGEWRIPVKFGLDIDEKVEADAFAVDHNNLTLTGAAGMAPWDLARIWDGDGYLALLTELAAEDVLPVSISGDDLDALLASGIDYDELWQGMPEFEQEDAGPMKTIKVHFVSPEDVNSFAELIGQTITAKTKYIWYPKMEREDLKKLMCQDES